MQKIKDLFNKSLDGDRKEERGFYRFVAIILFFFIIYISFFNKGKNIFHYVTSLIEISRQERVKKKYEYEISKMDYKINLLSTNKDTLEYYAREKFYLSAPDEDVYIIKKD